MADEYVLKSSVLNAIHNGDIDMGMVTPHEYRLLKDLSERIDRRIQRVPAADVAPVRHGQWIWDGYIYEAPWQCSNCGVFHDEDSNYCPNCGADMREVDNEPDS